MSARIIYDALQHSLWDIQKLLAVPPLPKYGGRRAVVTEDVELGWAVTTVSYWHKQGVETLPDLDAGVGSAYKELTHAIGLLHDLGQAFSKGE